MWSPTSIIGWDTMLRTLSARHAYYDLDVTLCSHCRWTAVRWIYSSRACARPTIDSIDRCHPFSLCLFALSSFVRRGDCRENGACFFFANLGRLELYHPPSCGVLNFVLLAPAATPQVPTSGAHHGSKYLHFCYFAVDCNCACVNSYTLTRVG